MNAKKNCFVSITPFHFACHIEERLRAQFEILDAVLGSFLQIQRRFSLTENRATLQFGAKPTSAEEFCPHVSLSIQLVPQKEQKTAFNCALTCPSQKSHKYFRLLLDTIEESETQILKILKFLQDSFLPLGYTTAKLEPIPTEAAVEAAAVAANNATLETAKALVQNAGKATQAEELTPEAAAVTGGKKYIYEKAPTTGEPVRMRTHDGKYVPEGELPAELRILDGTTSTTAPAGAATAAVEPTPPTTTQP